jgi:hypothetical protein
MLVRQMDLPDVGRLLSMSAGSFNAALNGVTNIELRAGDLFDSARRAQAQRDHFEKLGLRGPCGTTGVAGRARRRRCGNRRTHR